jgi:hypothetical protein
MNELHSRGGVAAFPQVCARVCLRTGARTVKPKFERTDPERFRDLKGLSTYAVGKTFARTIERWD